jgi:hypothetical protein
MSTRRSIIIIEDFYSDPDMIREYALRQRYYLPYQDEDLVRNGSQRAVWWSSWYRAHYHCPFKSSIQLIESLEDAVGEKIDMEHWKAHYPVDQASKPIPAHPQARQACLWNCSFHVKLDSGQTLGQGVHNHVTDGWNSVGPQGWAGIVYLSPAAELEGGLHLWTNINHDRQFDWMTPPSNWLLLDSFANIYNRLILCRGDLPHSGANGWGHEFSTGRMFQTFFFRTMPAAKRSVSVTRIHLSQ